MSPTILDGNFGPVREELTIADLEVTGTIPGHLDGRYLRNGPNPVVDPNPATHHWFLGSGMVHGVRLRDGKAEWYRNRYVRSADVADALGEPHHPGPIHAGFDFSVNTNVIGHAGRTYAIAEGGGNPYELTDELDTIGPCDFDGTLGGGYTAHPKLDPLTGELHAVSYFFGWGGNVRYTVTGVDGRVRRIVDIEVPGGPMMHDFSLTADHVIIYDLPVVFDLEAALSGAPKALQAPAKAVASRIVGKRPIPDRVSAAALRSGDAMLPYTWNPDHPARVGVMRRDSDGSDVRWFDVEPCYVFHPLNAYDDGHTIVLDVVRHPRMFDTKRLEPYEGVPTLDRWTVDLTAGKVLESRLDDRAQEFPRIDERVLGHRHRFGYAAAVLPNRDDENPLEANALLKHDNVTGHTDVITFGPNTHPGEFVFVPSSADANEDEGTLMGFVYERATNRSNLVMVDAESLETVATVHLPTRVPHGFHGNWISTPRAPAAPG